MLNLVQFGERFGDVPARGERREIMMHGWRGLRRAPNVQPGLKRVCNFSGGVVVAVQAMNQGSALAVQSLVALRQFRERLGFLLGHIRSLA